MTMNCPLGRLLSSSGIMSGRSIICKLWDGSFLPLEMLPLMTVRLPSALLSTSAVWLLGAKPPKMVHEHLVIMRDGTKIPIDDIADIGSEIFGAME